MVSFIEHGGGCCGVDHLHSFYGSERIIEEEFFTAIDDCLNNYYDLDEDERSIPVDPETFSHVFEMCLTDTQMVKYSKLLKKLGCKLLYRFKNSNSGNWVNILIYHNAEDHQGPYKEPPYEW